MERQKCRIEVLDENTGQAVGEVDVYTSADAVVCADGKTVEQRLGESGGGSGGTPMSAVEILTALKTVDGAGSGLDADTVSGKVVKTSVPADAVFTDTIYTHPPIHPASMIEGLPTELPANGGNSDTVGGKTVLTNVPANAKFTDTIYTHPETHPASMITGLPTFIPTGGDTGNYLTYNADGTTKWSKLSEQFAVTFKSSSWTATAYTLTSADISAMVANYFSQTNKVEVISGDAMTKDQITAWRSATVSKAEWNEDCTTLTITYVGDKPTIDIPVWLIVRRD